MSLLYVVSTLQVKCVLILYGFITLFKHFSSFGFRYFKLGHLTSENAFSFCDLWDITCLLSVLFHE